ncbi:MAG: hypothetical protein KGL10_02090 [Alphaproteobacteria bacterium]|nr:hypothetical protein [Alphaproteobacteria bacterium]MDE2336079.1 hypothetical protein [Alphaproteobacteria bacterium]
MVSAPPAASSLWNNGLWLISTLSSCFFTKEAQHLSAASREAVARENNKAAAF